MQRFTFAKMATVLLLAPLPRGHAQAAATRADLLPGSRIRVTTGAPARRVTGTLVGLDSDSLWVAVGKRDTVALPLSGVTRLEESRGRRANRRKGALIGGGVGLALGLGVGLLVDYGRSLGCESASCGNLGEALAIGGGAGAAVGAGVGALVAGAAAKERWQPVLPPGRALGFGLRLRF